MIFYFSKIKISCEFLLFKNKNSRIQETPNLSSDAQEREKTIRLDNVTRESNVMMYPMNDVMGEQIPLWGGWVCCK